MITIRSAASVINSTQMLFDGRDWQLAHTPRAGVGYLRPARATGGIGSRHTVDDGDLASSVRLALALCVLDQSSTADS